MPQIGDILSQKYELVRLLGEGGMGAVFEARHVLIGKRLAVKFLHPQFAQNSELVARFSREAQAAAAIGHRSIIDITDIGMSEDASVYLVMEFLEGHDFGATIHRNHGMLPVDQVAYITAQTLSALAAAHDAGIVHRDLKPDNIFLVATGQALPDIKLLDFGISKMTHSGNPQDRLTKTGTMMGTPYYMAPEQAKGAKHIDHRVDIYAMGVIMYEALTGTVPFQAENTFALAYEILNAELTPLRDHRPDLSPELEALVLKAMDRDMNGRFETAEEMLYGVLPFLTESARDRVTMPSKGSGEERLSVDPAMPSNPIITPAPGTGSGIGSVPSSSGTGTDMAWQSGIQTGYDAPRSRKGLVLGAIGACVVIAVLAVVGLLLFIGDEEESVRPPPPPVAASAPTPAPPVPSAAPAEATVTPPVANDNVTITLVGVPDDAQVFLDDAPIEGTVLNAPRSGTTRAVRIVYAGHQPWRRSVVFQRVWITAGA